MEGGAEGDRWREMGGMEESEEGEGERDRREEYRKEQRRGRKEERRREKKWPDQKYVRCL